MLMAGLVDASARVAATPSRTAKVQQLAALLAEVPTDELAVGVAALCGAPRQGRVGVGWATARIDGTASAPSLTIGDLDRLVDDLAAMSGPGVQAARRARLQAFGDRATPAEAQFVTRLLTGELRQGALAGVVEQAVAKACGVPATVVRRAAMLSGDLPGTAVLARTGGRAALDAVGLAVGVPVQPMLASTSASVADGLGALGEASVEWKLDGIRVQAHRRGDRVRLYTRNLNDITAQLPGVVDGVLALGLRECVLDGEVIGLREDGRPAAFQDALAAPVLVAHWFDVLRLDGDDLLDLPLSDRLGALAGVDGLRRMPGMRTSDAAAGEAVLEAALAAGHEGVVLKALDSPYAAGRRGKAWLKVKPVHTLDLVVLGVEWGSGRRQGLLSNLHLGARGPDGDPVMVGKTFKGLTDELLGWQTAELLAREVGREGHIVWVRPELVVEVAVDGAQRSSRYPGGVALRFARVRRYRPDKVAAEADSLDAVRALLAG